MEEPKYDIEKIRSFIKRCTWKWARTYLTCPHEYITLDKGYLSDEEFAEFLSTCRTYGNPERFGHYNHNYLYVDGYKYWTMKSDTLINRQKVFYEFYFIPFPYKRYYAEEANKKVVDAVLTNYEKPVYEIGFGNGDFVRQSNIESNYKAVDSNKKACAAFKEEFPMLARCVAHRSFEEGHDTWVKNEHVVVALFGTASYVMTPYLDILSKKVDDYFLMFYKEGFIPDVFKEMHAFERTKEELRRIFPKAFIMEGKEYYLVSNKLIDWSKEYVKPKKLVQQKLFE